MFRRQRRANATDSDWQAHTEDSEEESEEGQTSQEDGSHFVDSFCSSTSQSSTSSSSSTSGYLSSAPSSTEEVQAHGCRKRLTKTCGTALPRHTQGAKRKSLSTPNVAAKQHKK